jgi:hypothetical protein
LQNSIRSQICAFSVGFNFLQSAYGQEDMSLCKKSNQRKNHQILLAKRVMQFPPKKVAGWTGLFGDRTTQDKKWGFGASPTCPSYYPAPLFLANSPLSLDKLLIFSPQKCLYIKLQPLIELRKELFRSCHRQWHRFWLVKRQTHSLFPEIVFHGACNALHSLILDCLQKGNEIGFSVQRHLQPLYLRRLPGINTIGKGRDLTRLARRK